MIAAILAGNAVIVKPSPQTPTTVEQFYSAFVEAGLPKGVFQYFHCGEFNDLEKFVRNPLINHISFTGSVAAGLRIKQAAAGRVVNVGLELGGNDPAYVREDADIPWVADEVTDGAVFNSGQSCCALERVYVHEKVHDIFVQEAQKVLSKYVLGDPADSKTQVGPVISARARENILEVVKDALEKGAQDVTPPNQTFDKLPPEGNFVKPTLLIGVTQDMKIMQEETFGPVIPVMKVKDDEDAIQKMNDSDLGLTASVWTKDITTAEEKLLPRIEAGTVFINRSDYPSPVSPSLFVYVLNAADTDLHFPGSGVDRTQRLWRRCHSEPLRLRSVHQAEELSCERPSEKISQVSWLIWNQSDSINVI